MNEDEFLRYLNKIHQIPPNERIRKANQAHLDVGGTFKVITKGKTEHLRDEENNVFWVPFDNYFVGSKVEYMFAKAEITELKELLDYTGQRRAFITPLEIAEFYNWDLEYATDLLFMGQHFGDFVYFLG